MPNILREILDHKRLEIAQRQQSVSQDQLIEQIADLPRPRNFFQAVTKKSPRGINLIAEVKRASPSAGTICEDFDPVDVARRYHHAGADAVSVLTDEKFFGGSLDFLRGIKNALPLPVMRKDFIIDPYQVYESRAAGADAVLLIAEALPGPALMDLLILTSSLNLSVLLEVHTAESLLRCRSLIGFPTPGYSVLGINNRNLETFQVDISHTSRLADMLDDTQPGLVSESGIDSAADIEQLKRAGCSAVLIGQTLMQAPDIRAKIDELLGPDDPKRS